MKEYNFPDEEKIVATLISNDGTETQVKVARGWQEIHIPKINVPPRFYTKPTEHRSDFEYQVFSKDRDAEGEVFRENGSVVVSPEVKAADSPIDCTFADEREEEAVFPEVLISTGKALDIIAEIPVRENTEEKKQPVHSGPAKQLGLF